MPVQFTPSYEMDVRVVSKQSSKLEVPATASVVHCPVSDTVTMADPDPHEDPCHAVVMMYEGVADAAPRRRRRTRRHVGWAMSLLVVVAVVVVVPLHFALWQGDFRLSLNGLRT